MRGVQGLGVGDGCARAAVQIRVMLLGEDTVGGADLRIGATAVKAERGVMIWYRGLQGRKLNGVGVEIPESWVGVFGSRRG